MRTSCTGLRHDSSITRGRDCFQPTLGGDNGPAVPAIANQKIATKAEPQTRLVLGAGAQESRQIGNIRRPIQSNPMTSGNKRWRVCRKMD